MEDGGPVVNHYYRMHITRESEAYRMKQLGVLRIKYLTTEDREIKPEVIRNLGELYNLIVYNQYSGDIKVNERRDEKFNERFYDATSERYETLKTGLTYEYIGLKKYSVPSSGKVVDSNTQVFYEYRLVSKEDPKPAKREVKGSVIVKYVDADGNEIKDAEKVVTDAVVKTTKTYTTKSGDVVVSTRDEVENHEVQYNTAEKKVDTITKDGKKYNYQGIYAPSEKFHNVTAETGKVAEGLTTIVYRYELEVENKDQWEVPKDSPTKEEPEYKGGVVSVEPPIHEVPEYEGGAASIESPIYEVPEYKWSTMVAPPILIVPEYRGQEALILPPVLTDEQQSRLPIKDYFVVLPQRQLQDIPTVEKLEKAVEKLQEKTIVKESRLPNTGENSTNALSVGGIMLVLGIILGIKRRKKQSNMFLKITI